MQQIERCQRGFTLVELIITLSVLTIMLLIATPSFFELIESNKLRTTKDLLVSALYTAQQQAISKNVPVYFCPSSDGKNCDDAWHQNDGWLVYEDMDRSEGLDNGEIILSQVDIKVDRIISDQRILRFLPMGQVTNNTFTLCSNSDAQNDEKISISRMGRVSYAPSGSFCGA